MLDSHGGKHSAGGKGSLLGFKFAGISADCLAESPVGH